MSAAEIGMALASSFVGGGLGGVVGARLGHRRSRRGRATLRTPSAEAPDLDDQVWAASRAWAERRGRPDVAPFVYGYVRDAAQHFVGRRRER